MGILEFRDSVIFPAFSGEVSQQHLPFRVAPALVFVEIVGQLPRERAAVEVEISRFVHAVQLSGQIVLVVVALAAVRQRQWRVPSASIPSAQTPNTKVAASP